jgi:hypothetical protein
MVSKINDNGSFIIKAKEVHGDKYDYSYVSWISNIIQVEIVCPTHGSFWQTPTNHIHNKNGCPKCGKISQIRKRASTTEKFIQKAKEVHGDKYDYSKVDYVNNLTKVEIICQMHGSFWQTPAGHLKGGCQKCGKILMSQKQSLTQEKFIQKAKEVHGDKYDYSKVDYVNNLTKVEIICQMHGSFWQTPGNHLMGSGCCKCGRLKTVKDNTQEEFIQKAKEVHGDKYDYSKVNYVSMLTKATITCSTHGDFEQLPSNHLYNKQGCPKCASIFSKPEEEFRQFIQSIIPAYKTSRGEIIPKQELDVFIPSRKIAFEFNGRYWHEHIDAEERDERKRHSCEKLGIKLYVIWDDEWKNDKEETKQRIREIIFGINT